MVTPASNLRFLLPFLVVGLAKALLIAALARPDSVPSLLLAPLLVLLPGVESHLRYPQLVLRLPEIARALDVALFLTVQVGLQAWAISAFGRAWTGSSQPWWRFQGIAALLVIAVLLLAAPFATLRIGSAFGGGVAAGHAALAVGTLVQMVLFAAPAYVLLLGMGLRAAVASSAGLLGQLPLAIPLAVIVLAALHAPTVVLRGPVLAVASGYDPDWILWTLLGQIPADVLGGYLAAALSTSFVVRMRHMDLPIRSSRSAVALGAIVLITLQSSGCDLDRARDVRMRYAAERRVERADRRAAELVGAAGADSVAWLHVGEQYEGALSVTGEDWIATRAVGSVRIGIAKLAGRALLGRADAWSRAGRHAPAQAEFERMLAKATAYPGMCSDAALGLARAIDRSGDWNAAHAAYLQWLEGVAAGTWPLHRNGLEVPGYVSRRLRARGENAARADWIARAEGALEAAAERGSLARAARSSRFVLLLEAERWEDAYASLRRMRELHDPTGRDGALLFAEASLLAGGLGRPNAALGVLAGLTAEKNPFDSQHRVAGWLLAAQIHVRDSAWGPARTAFEHAASEARSDAGHSEALLGLARVHVALDEIDEARRTFTQLRELYGNTAAGLRASLEELQLLRRRGVPEDVDALLPVVVHHYRRVLQQYGTETPALLAAAALSECFGVTGQWDRGVTLLDSLSGTLASDARAGTLLVRAARIAVDELHDPPRARRLLASLQTRYPRSDVAVLARALDDSLRIGVP